MSYYETTFVVRQDATHNEVQKLTEKFSGIIAENGGKVVTSEYWGLLNLAYQAKKCSKGHYVMLIIDAPFAAVKEMHRVMSLSEDVILRENFAIEKLPTEPSVMMRKESRHYEDLNANANAE